MYLILQQEIPEDFILAKGIAKTISDFFIMGFAELGIHLEFRGKDDFEEGYIKNVPVNIN